MKSNNPDRKNLHANLHLFLLALCITHASLSAAVWIASCELSDDYQIGMDRMHFMFNPIWGWLGMFVVSLCFWRVWAIRQLTLSLWGLIAISCVVFVLLQSGSSQSNQFRPASDIYATVTRSVLQPSLSNDSVALIFFGVAVTANSALVVGWLGLFATGQNETARLRVKIFAIAFVLPWVMFISFISLKLQQIWMPLIFGLVLGTLGAPIVYLAICVALRAPQKRFPLLIISALIAAIPALLCGGLLTVIVGVPILLICGIVSASFINLPKRNGLSAKGADHYG